MALGGHAQHKVVEEFTRPIGVGVGVVGVAVRVYSVPRRISRLKRRSHLRSGWRFGFGGDRSALRRCQGTDGRKEKT